MPFFFSGRNLTNFGRVFNQRWAVKWGPDAWRIECSEAPRLQPPWGFSPAFVLPAPCALASAPIPLYFSTASALGFPLISLLLAADEKFGARGPQTEPRSSRPCSPRQPREGPPPHPTNSQRASETVQSPKTPFKITQTSRTIKRTARSACRQSNTMNDIPSSMS